MKQFVFLIVIILALVAWSPGAQQKSRRKPNSPPSIESFSSSLRIVPICPFFTHFDKPEVRLLVVATDPDVDSLHYEYSTSEGTISGVGKSVLWLLEGLPRGEHHVQVTVTDGKGGKVTGALTVTTVDAGICDRPPPPCPVVKVS